MDFKSECTAGDTVESLAAEQAKAKASAEANGNGNGASSSSPQSFLHTLRRCDENGCQELVRAITRWG